MYGSEYSPLPALILCLAVCVQGFSQMAMRRRMVAGDEEYREPNKLLRAAVAAIVVISARPVGRGLPPGKGLGRHEEHSKAAEKAGRAAPGGHGEGAWREPPDDHRPIENDKYNPTLELAMKIARLLGLHVDEIFYLDD